MSHESLLYHQGNRYIYQFFDCLQGLYKYCVGQNYCGSNTDVSGEDTCMRAKIYCTPFQEITCINSQKMRNL